MPRKPPRPSPLTPGASAGGKSGIAQQVRIAPGSGKIEINGRTLNEYLTSERDRKAIFGPLEVTNTGGKMDIWVNAAGGVRVS